MLNALLMAFNSNRYHLSKEQTELMRNKRDRLRGKIIDLLEKENAVLILPTWAHTPMFRGYAAWSNDDLTYTAIWNILSLPALQCPTGLSRNGLPTGMQIVGAPKSEKTLIQVGKYIGEYFGGWQAQWAKGQ
uniref:Amidase domain-containing protein n=1 Tax=Steinernema glaseri TaxID=37863 RepID=A0A1I8AN57_9BILA